jgi:hypothetical protein
LAADFERERETYLAIADAAQEGLDPGGSLTVVGWLKAGHLDTWQVVVAKYDLGIKERAYRLDLRYADMGFIVSPNGSFSSDYLLQVSPATPLEEGVWHHVAGVFDGEARTLAVYVDGALAGWRSVSYGSVHDATAPFMLGANLSSGSALQPFDGQLDEWRVYSRALTESEIAALMTSTVSSFSR